MEDGDDVDARSTLSFDSDDSAERYVVRASEADKIASPPVQIFVKTLTGRTRTYDLSLLSGNYYVAPGHRKTRH